MHWVFKDWRLKLKSVCIQNTRKKKKTYRQIFQFQLTDCVVRFDVFWHKGELEIGIFKDSIFLLSVWPILGTFNLKRRFTLHKVYPRETSSGSAGQTRHCHTLRDKTVRKRNHYLQILSLWLGLASLHRGSSAPTPFPRSCHMCLEGVPKNESEVMIKVGFIFSKT